jgi:hypothetical protein
VACFDGLDKAYWRITCNGAAVPADGAVLDTLISLLYTAAGLNTSGTRTLTATDRAGNVSPRAGDPAAAFTVHWDATPPALGSLTR